MELLQPGDPRIAQSIAEWLLIETLPDLTHRARPGAPTYDRLGIAALVRRTLTDNPKNGKPVVHAARERLGLAQPLFSWAPMELIRDESGPGWKTRIAFAGESFSQPEEQGTIDDLLAAPAAFYRGDLISVNEVNRYFAHVNGAVHLGAPDPESEFEAAIQAAVASVPTMGGIWSETLAAIAEVVVRGLQPIADEIARNPMPQIRFAYP